MYYNDGYGQVYEEVQKTYNNYMFLYYVIPIVVIALVFGIIALSLLISISKTRKRQLEINLNTMRYLKKENFNITTIFYFSDQATFRKDNSYKKMVAVDDENKKFALVNYAARRVIIADYKDFLNYEIYENSEMVISGGAVGGLGLGFFGATASGQCKELRLIMRIANPKIPQVAYDVLPRTFFNIGIHKNSTAYRDCMESLQQLVSFFEVIKHQNEKSA